MNLEKRFVDFMNRHYKGDEQLLLGLSGGPDSLALFHLLQKYGISFAVAHVDHGWRAESGEESLILRKLAEDNGHPFYEKKLQGVLTEAACREERIKFFSELLFKYHFKAVVLGHHRDDQLETVFKRILEGASLTNIGGMGEVSTLNGMQVWRPLIKVEKKEILSWIEKQNLKPFFDSTNHDTQYLRNRMRKKILPNLSAVFGKEIDNSILHLGEESKEIQFFLNQHLAPILNTIESSSLGYFLDLNPYLPLTPFELKYLIKTFCKKAQWIPSREMVETAADLIQKGASNKELIGGSNRLYIDRKRLFLAKRMEKMPSETQSLIDSMDYGPWKISLKEGLSLEGDTCWKGAWKGKMRVILPRNSYSIGPSRTPKISKWWNNHKIPAFLGSTVPAIWHQGTLVHEFLTGKKLTPQIQTQDLIEVTLLHNSIENESFM